MYIDMKKKFLWLTIIPFLISACQTNNGQSITSSDIDDGVGFVKKDVSIDFLCFADNHYINELQGMIADFKNVEPHVTVNLINPLSVGNYSVLEKIVISGFFKEDYPDLAQCYPDNVVKYMERDYVVSLDKYLNDPNYGLGEEKDDYIPEFLNEGMGYSKEGTYSLPFCKSTELMYYNADVLLGLNLSTIDSSINNGQPLDADYLDSLSWEELFGKLCPAIKEYNQTNKIFETSGNYGIVTYDSDENFFITLAEQYGYGYTSYNKESGQGSIDFENDGMKALMKTMKSAKDNGYLETRGSYGDYVSSLFKSRHSLFTISSTASTSYNLLDDGDLKDGLVPFNIGVAKIPHAAGKNYASINQGPSICILDHHDDNRSLAAFLFWKHITNKNNSASWPVHTGYMGIRHSVYESEAYRNSLIVDENSTIAEKLTAANMKKTADVSGYTFNTAIFNGSSDARSNAGKLLIDCLLSDDLDAEIDTLFKTYADEARSHLD